MRTTTATTTNNNNIFPFWLFISSFGVWHYFWLCSLKLFNNFMAIWQKMASVIVYFPRENSISSEKFLFPARNFCLPRGISISRQKFLFLHWIRWWLKTILWWTWRKEMQFLLCVGRQEISLLSTFMPIAVNRNEV